MNLIRNQKGFSLVELLMASFLSTMVIGAFFLSMRTYSANGNEIYVKMNMTDQGMNALRKMEHELRATAPSRVTLGGGGSSITFQIPSETSPVTSAYAVNWAGAHSITYSISGTQLIRTDTSATTETTPRTLCNFASGVTFAVPSTGIVTVALNLQQTLTNTRVLTQALSARVELRNP